MTDPATGRLRLAVPNKGRMVEPTLRLLHDAGLVFEQHDRSLVSRVQNFDLDITGTTLLERALPLLAQIGRTVSQRLSLARAGKLHLQAGDRAARLARHQQIPRASL